VLIRNLGDHHPARTWLPDHPKFPSWTAWPEGRGMGANRLGKETNSSSQLPLGYVSLQKKRYDILGHYMPIHVISNKIKEGAPPNSGKGNAGLPKAQIWLKIPKDTELWK